MDRRTFLKSASMKGTAIVTASAVGTESFMQRRA